MNFKIFLKLETKFLKSLIFKLEDFTPSEIFYKFPKLRKGIYIKRLNRFSGLLKLKNEIIKVHIPNSGRLQEALKEGREAYFYFKKKEKTDGVLQLIRNEEKFISVDTRIPNKLVETLLKKKLPDFSVKKEAQINGRRVDFLIEGSIKIWIETKSITLVENGVALFPDSPTLRGREHIKELIKIKENGGEGAIIFIAQREDAEKFSPNKRIDSEFSRLLSEANLKGIEIIAFNCSVNPERISLNKKLEVIL